jgi:hypothetical protein
MGSECREPGQILVEMLRIADWGEKGEYRCLRCAKNMTFHFNGGELDWRECCGLIYQTEITRVDFVVREKDW